MIQGVELDVKPSERVQTTQSERPAAEDDPLT